MKNYFSKPFVLLGMVLLFSSGLHAQSIHFNYTNGTNASYYLQDVRKITFTADVMNLIMWDGSVYSWNVSTIGYYEYNESSLSVEDWLNDAHAWAIAIFPNPTSKSLNVRFNLPKDDVITIGLFDLQGKLIEEKKLGKQEGGERQEIFDVSNLPKGTYVCRIDGLYQSVTKTVIKS